MSCITPYTAKNKITNETNTFPCGKCPPCVKRRISGWSFRLLQEDKRALSSIFVTLTYDDKNVPFTQSGLMTLQKQDVQKFFKRLRKNFSHPIKYYACGEYGTLNNRPHYHAIIFNASHEAIAKAWKLNDHWIGDIHYGDVSGASVGYTLKYMCKPRKIPIDSFDDRSSEFALMSKGLGENYISKKSNKWHLADLENRMYLPIEDGKKIAMPRYYKDKLYTQSERERIAFFSKINAVLKNEKEFQKLYDEYGEYSNKVKADYHHFEFQKMYDDYKKGRNL